MRPSARRGSSLLAVVAVVVAACSGPILANPAAARPVVTPGADRRRRAPPDPQPVELPRDDGPHDRLTEWWYYTGHLRAGDGARFGFEYVVFRAERGGFPVSWASHLALTDETGGRVPLRAAHARSGRRSTARRADAAGEPDGLRAHGHGPRPAGATPPPTGTPWTMAGAQRRGPRCRPLASAARGARRSRRRLRARPARSRRASRRRSTTRTARSTSARPAARTTTRGPRWTATGTVTPRATRRSRSTGDAWFDHQWGDFISVGGGGWDWFAVNLDDGTDLTLSLVRAADGTYPLVYGTLVDADGHRRATSTGTRSPSSVTDTGRARRPGATYPAGWTRAAARARTSRSSSGPRSPSRSSTRARRRASCTGRGRRS